MRVVPDDDCGRPDQEFIVHNPLNHDRFICDGAVIVPAKGFAHVSNDDCKEDMTKSRLFSATPTLENAKLMPHITMRFEDADEPLVQKEFPCDVPCHGVPDESVEFSIVDTPWVVQRSMESTVNYPELEIDVTAHRYNQFYATTSSDSEIPLPCVLCAVHLCTEGTMCTQCTTTSRLPVDYCTQSRYNCTQSNR